MTTPVNNSPSYDLMTFSGVFGSASEAHEIWSFSLKFEPTQGTTETMAQIGVDAYTQWLVPIMPFHVALTEVRYSMHEAGGATAKNAEGGYVQTRQGVNVQGAAAGAIFPLQTALCVSLGSARAGASGKGRFYLPMPPWELGGDGRFSATAQASGVTQIGGFLNFLHADLAQPLVIVSPTYGTRSAVTHFRLGRTPDTMRSRRNALLESYVQASVS